MKTRTKMILAGAALAAMSGAVSAHDRFGFSLSIGMPAPYVSSAPIYVAPAPRVVVRQRGPSVYYARPIVSTFPVAPVVYGPRVVVRHRYVSRHEWRPEWRYEHRRGNPHHGHR